MPLTALIDLAYYLLLQIPRSQTQTPAHWDPHGVLANKVSLLCACALPVRGGVGGRGLCWMSSVCVHVWQTLYVCTSGQAHLAHVRVQVRFYHGTGFGGNDAPSSRPWWVPQCVR